MAMASTTGGSSGRDPPPGYGAEGGGGAAALLTEWVEIIEPRTGEHMYANLTTGECVWDPPVGVPVKKTNDDQWWELFDQNTSRFYYYNASTQRTVWHRPANCDIIPLAKLQTLKQNTEVIMSSAASNDLDDEDKTLSPGKRRHKRQMSRHHHHRRKGSEDVLTQTSPSPLTRLQPQPASSTTNVYSSSLVQTSPVTSPRSSRRKSGHKHNHPRQYYYAPPEVAEEEPQHLLRSAGGSLRISKDSLSPLRRPSLTSPSKKVSLSRQRSLEGDNFKAASSSDQPQSGLKKDHQPLPASDNLISRSVSFMSKQPPHRNATDINNFFTPVGWKTASKEATASTGGRRSVETTPQPSKRSAASAIDNNGHSSPNNNKSDSLRPLEAANNSSRSLEVTSPIEGYCTPLTNRRRSSVEKPQPKPRTLLLDKNKDLTSEAKRGQKNGSASKAVMSPLQAYILEQAKLSGYNVEVDRDSYVESDLEDRDRLASDSDDFADDEDGGCGSDTASKASSVEEESDYLISEPTYNNLDPVWLQHLGKLSPSSAHKQAINKNQGQGQGHPLMNSSVDVDAFSEEFDLRMRFGRSNNTCSTMPRQGQSQNIQGQGHMMQNYNYPVPYEVLHPSLQRNAHSLMVDPATTSALLAAQAQGQGQGQKGQNTKIHPRTSSESHNFSSKKMLGGSSLSVSASIASNCESDIEKYAQDNLNVQKRGIFRKKMAVKDILTWTTEGISKPLTCLSTSEKASSKKEAVCMFRLLQIYMGDRKAKPGMTINSVALDITCTGYSRPSLRDEIFVQICKQTTDNPKKDSLRRGWELLAICLAFFPPSATFGPYLQGYIGKHRDPALDDFPDVGKWPIHVQISHYAGICAKRLDRIGDGGRLSPKKPSLEDIDQSRLQIFRPSMFGGTLNETMEVQRERFPHNRLPWILTTAAEQILLLNGTKTEGIFRVPADLEEVQSVKSRFDQWEVVACSDCHTAASLLKFWLRDLYEPLIPDAFYEECVQVSMDGTRQSKEYLDQLVGRLPELNRLVLLFLVRFLQLFARPQVAGVTKMDASNLATVFAPNCLRCPSSDPCVIMENTRKEMAFVKLLIVSLDTDEVEGVV